MDGLPLGNQSYGNYNGLSPQRTVISESVSRVLVATGAGDLATASNSNLGGTVETCWVSRTAAARPPAGTSQAVGSVQESTGFWYRGRGKITHHPQGAAVGWTPQS